MTNTTVILDSNCLQLAIIIFDNLLFLALQEDWLHENEALADGISFYVKVKAYYKVLATLGMALSTDELIR